MTDWRLYFRLIAVSLQAQMQYRASFAMMAAGHLCITAIEILGIWVLFERFGALGSWRLAEVAVFYGVVHIAFALAEATARGFDVFPQLVRSGEFDRVLLRPRSAALQIAAREWQLMRVGRLAQGLGVLGWALLALDLPLGPARLALLTFAVLGGMALFYGLFVLQATLSFWTVDSLELVNTLTYGGTETAQFLLSIYRPWFRRFFTFVVPLAAFSYYPVLAVLGRSDPLLASPAWVGWVSPLCGPLFLLFTLQVWRLGVRHYHSTGS
jgi:ABC-2 type transport system permease protein